MAILCLTDPAQLLTALSLAPVLGIAVTIRGKEENLGLKELREKGGELNAEIQRSGKEFNERRKKRDAGQDVELWPDNTRDEWEAVNKDYDAVRSAIEEEQRAADVAARCAETQEFNERSLRDDPNRTNLDDRADGQGRTYGDLGFDDRDHARQWAARQRDLGLAFAVWAMRGIDNDTIADRHHEACERLKFNPAVNELRLQLLPTEGIRTIQRTIRSKHHDQRAEAFVDLLEGRALSGLTGGSGGYLVAPGQLLTSIELAAIEFGAILRVAETITTATGEEIAWPVGDDTDNEGAYADENQDHSTEANPAFEQVKWGAFDMHSKMCKVPFSLMRDSVFNLAAILGRMMGERLGRKTSSECTTGQTRIRGIVPRTPEGQEAAAAAALDRADFVGLQHSIDPSLRPGSRFMFHDNILEAVRLIEDENGNPIYQSNARVGAPDTIEGWGFEINQKMADTVEASAKTVLGGRLEYYKVRRAGILRLKRLVERYAEYDQTAFIAYWSVDGNLLRPQQDTACPVKHLAQPA